MVYMNYKGEIVDDELYHHGIKGQKWYVRRFQNEDGSLTALGRARRGLKNTYDKAKVKASEARHKHRIKKAMKTGKLSHLTEDELNEVVERLSLEKKVQDLRKDTRKQNAGKKVVGEILISGAKTLGDAAFQKVANNIKKESKSQLEKEEDYYKRLASIAKNKADIEKEKNNLHRYKKEREKTAEKERKEAEEKRKKAEEEKRKKDVEWVKDYISSHPGYSGTGRSFGGAIK